MRLLRAVVITAILGALVVGVGGCSSAPVRPVERPVYVPPTLPPPAPPTLPPPAPPRPTRNPGHPGPIAAEPNFIWPVKGTVVGRFGQKVPWLLNEPNRGLDIRCAAGAPVNAAKSGRVNAMDQVPGFGPVVVLDHSDGSSTFYARLDDILVTPGTWVRQGERVATVGSDSPTGSSALHFRLLRRDRQVDPLPLLTAR